MNPTDPPRPATVPAEAWWSPEDNEWILGDKDSEGRFVGTVKYWRPDGTLCNEWGHADGIPHGWSVRYHETGEVSQRLWNERGKMHGLREWFWTDGHTTEKVRAEGLSTKVWRGQMDCEHGIITAFRYYDREGREVGLDGEILPPRPVGVPANALRSTKSTDWYASHYDNKTGKPIGLLRRWTDAGVLAAEELYEGETIAITDYRRLDGSRRSQYVMQSRRITGDVLTWRRDGTLWVRASFGADQSTIEHLGADGNVVRRTEYARPVIDFPNPTAPADDEGEPDLSSPAGMARAIAQGWGGSDDRDAGAARQMRRLVRKTASASLTETLARLQLDRSPRWQTPMRVTNDLAQLAADPSVDGGALENALISAGGPGAMLALADPKRAYAYLAAHRNAGKMRLVNLGLTALPAAIGHFHDTSSLDVEGNRLVTLPDEIGDMFELSRLDLSNNRIRSLPRTLTWLPWLRTLYLSENDLVTLPSTVFELVELRTLSAGGNEIEEIPEAIGDMLALEDLSLYDNNLRDLPKSLARLPLTFLHLGDHNWAEPPSVVGEIETLETLWIASHALERLPVEIVKLPRLRKLMLWHSNVSEVPPELFEATHLQELRISNNPLPAGTIEKLKEALPNCAIY